MMKLEEILAKLEPEERVFLSSLIDKDPLTGAYNRRKFDRDIEVLAALYRRTNKGSGLLMIDIDHFKKFNDEHGHQSGDHVLKEVARCIAKNLRDYDTIHIYRYGGEEFVIIIPDVSPEESLRIGERLRTKVKATCPVTISVGISHYQEISDDLQALIKHADYALYEAKKKGRDKVQVYEKPSP
ncbi:MAG: GGDEF domain-containing protein [Pseudomonadota bacterium]